MNNYIPKTLNFSGGDLVEVAHLEKSFSITRRVALKYLRALRIKPLYIGEEIYYSLPTFNKIMFVLSRPGSPGFLFPSSKGRNKKNLRKDGEFLVEVTDDILAQAASPQTMAEMAASTGTDTSMVKKLLSHDNATRKDQK